MGYIIFTITAPNERLGSALNVIVWAVAAVAVALNLHFSRQITAYKKALFPPFLAEGQTARRIVGFDLDGKRADLELTTQPPGQRTLLITMSPVVSDLQSERSFLGQYRPRGRF